MRFVWGSKQRAANVYDVVTGTPLLTCACDMCFAGARGQVQAVGGCAAGAGDHRVRPQRHDPRALRREEPAQLRAAHPALVRAAMHRGRSLWSCELPALEL